MLLQILEFEESIGKLYNSFLTRTQSHSFKESEVLFENKSKTLHTFHKLLGGDTAKELHITDKRFVDTSAPFLQKLSGGGASVILCWQDADAVYLPQSLSYFKDTQHNELLYFWLIAMSAITENIQGSTVYKNYTASQFLIQKYSGFALFYEEALALLIQTRPELSLLLSLNTHNIHDALYLEKFKTLACPLWIYPSLLTTNTYTPTTDEEHISRTQEQDAKTQTLHMKKQSKQIDDTKQTDGFLAFLPESIMSIMESVNVDRSEDDSYDEDALYNAEDLDEITLGQKKANLCARLKMDLDLEYDTKEEYPIGKGRFLDEWDYRKKSYLKNYVRVQPYLTTNIQALALPARLKKTVRTIQNELDLLQFNRIKNTHLSDGDEIHLDAWIDYKGLQNKSSHQQNFYESHEKKLRDMSTLLLADVSLSTEAGIRQDVRVIDLIKDGLIVFAEALEKLQDNFAIYSFSSIKNTNVRFEIIKNFKEKYTAHSRGRIDAMKAGYYTRLGAAIREASSILTKEKSQNKLLLIISDGKPNDVDRYDGRYGIEDTKKSIEDAKKLGLIPFCITIDVEAKEYLPYLFGKDSFKVIKNSSKLPRAITEIYIHLTQ